MKKIIAAVLATALLLGLMPSCYGAEDAVTTLVSAMQSFETEVTVKTQDAEGTLQSVFYSNPELFYYFESYSATTSKNGKKTTFTFTYHNTDVATESIFVVTGADDLYNVIGYGLSQTAQKLSVVFTDSTLGEDDIINAIYQWKEDYYLIYMGYTSVNAIGYTSTESAFSAWTGYTLEFSYMDDGQVVQEMRQKTLAVVQELCTTLFALDMPDWQKVLLIHDYLVTNCSYDQTAADSNTYSTANTVYGCLVEGSAVCEGYAQAAQLLFQVAGLNSYYVEGAGESADHAWNCVEVDGEYYWVDVTWDDPVPAEGESENLYHTYFNLTDSELNVDHSWQTSQYPTCTATTWTYSAVKEALSAITNSDGTLNVEYENYSTENIKSLDRMIDDLEYELGVTASTLTATVTTDDSGEVEEEADTAEAAQTEAETESHPIRNTILRILLVLVLLVVAYLIYWFIMWRRYLARKRKRAQARKKAAAQGKVAPAPGKKTSSGSGTPKDRPKTQRVGKKSGDAAGETRRKTAQKSRSTRSRRENPFR